MTGYEAAKAKYEALGVDTDRAIERLKKVPVSLHCWQLDDVIGFDNDGGLTGGIETTGNYPGRARTPQQLMEDIYRYDIVKYCPHGRPIVIEQTKKDIEKLFGRL